MSYADAYCKRLDRRDFRRITRPPYIAYVVFAGLAALVAFWPRPRALPSGCVQLNLPNPQYQAFVCHQ